MNKFFILFGIFTLTAGISFAKGSGETMKIRYQSSYHGKIIEGYHREMIISNGIAKIEIIRDEADDTPVKQTFIDYVDKICYQTAILNNNEAERYTVKFDFRDISSWKITDDSITWIQGFPCRMAHIVVNSNHINIWFTQETALWGTIQPGYGVPDGLVLKIDVNGNRVEEAVDISYEKKGRQLLPESWGTFIESRYYSKILNESGVVTVKVFDNEIIEFNPDLPKPVSFDEENRVYRVGNGAVLLKKIKLPDSIEGYDVFLELIHHAEDDAYDRTGTVFLIPTDKKRTFLEALLHGLDTLPGAVITEKGESFRGIVATEDYNPPVELMRFFTSFGVHGYGRITYGDYQWADSVIFKQEITHVSQYLEKEAWIGVCIGNWTKNAHRVSLSLKYHPEGKGGKTKAIPLFFAMNVLEMQWQEMPDLFDDDAFSFSYNLPEPIQESSLCYLSTGHGGWGGGDEFNRKINSVFSDNELVLKYIPWREDCASYRLLNPASGNFGNGLSSSDLSRSGWCPGTITNPVYIPMPGLQQGKHSLKITIPQGAPEGNSRSHWTISGMLIERLETRN